MEINAAESGIMLQMGMALTRQSEEVAEKVVETLMDGLPPTGDGAGDHGGSSGPEGVGQNVNIVA